MILPESLNYENYIDLDIFIEDAIKANPEPSMTYISILSSIECLIDTGVISTRLQATDDGYKVMVRQEEGRSIERREARMTEMRASLIKQQIAAIRGQNEAAKVL